MTHAWVRNAVSSCVATYLIVAAECRDTNKVYLTKAPQNRIRQTILKNVSHMLVLLRHYSGGYLHVHIHVHQSMSLHFRLPIVVADLE